MGHYVVRFQVNRQWTSHGTAAERCGDSQGVMRLAPALAATDAAGLTRFGTQHWPCVGAIGVV